MIDFSITTESGAPVFSLEAGDALRNNVLLSLLVRRGTLFVAPEFGSRLHTITKVSADAPARAQAYCVEATRWIIETGRAREITVDARIHDENNGRIDIAVMVTKPDGERTAFTTWFAVV